MKTSKLLISLAFAGLVGIQLSAHAAKVTETTSSNGTPDIAGNYQCKGYDPGGNSNYSSPLSVTKNGDTYTFQWLNSNGYPYILGTGFLSTNVTNALSVVFWDPKKADYFGTLLYSVNKSDGSLTGSWVVQGTKVLGTENCTKNK